MCTSYYTLFLSVCLFVTDKRQYTQTFFGTAHDLKENLWMLKIKKGIKSLPQSQVFTVRFQRFRVQKILVCGKDSTPLPLKIFDFRRILKIHKKMQIRGIFLIIVLSKRNCWKIDKQFNCEEENLYIYIFVTSLC